MHSAIDGNLYVLSLHLILYITNNITMELLSTLAIQLYLVAVVVQNIIVI